MEDDRIVELYWSRSENAIAETSKKYGKYCYAIAYNILANAEDANEIVNDTYLGAWNSMPPHRPSALSTFLGKITRRASFDKWKMKKAEKRGKGEIPLALDELSEIIISPDTPEEIIIVQELTKAINRFLASLSELERNMFVCRYWFFGTYH